MNKSLLFLLCLCATTFLLAVDIPLSTVQPRSFGASIDVNAKVITQNNDQYAVVAPLGGLIEAYYVRVGDSVRKGDKIARLNSIEVSKLNSEYRGLKTQLDHFNQNHQSDEKLYERGMLSKQEITTRRMERDRLVSHIQGIESQFSTSKISPKSLKNGVTSNIVYASRSGQIGEIFQPLGSYVKEENPLASIIDTNAFYLQCFVPSKYASKIQKGQKVLIKNGSSTPLYATVERVLPIVDEATQRISVLASISAPSKELFLNQYVGATIYTQKDKSYLAVKKSALSFFQNEWVVFVPVTDKHSKKEENEKVSYEARVVKLITQDDQFSALEGLKISERYVSDKSYYVKSMLLKSAIGEE